MQTNDTIFIKCDIATTNPAAALGVKVLLNQVVVYENSHVQDTINFSHEIDDADGEHELVFEMFGKLPEHTKIDSDGNIVEDSMLVLSNFVADEIDSTRIVFDHSEYHHDFNGSQPATIAKFYGNLGCNGQVRLKFITPIYIWLLENM